jgi:hypothetical protein
MSGGDYTPRQEHHYSRSFAGLWHLWLALLLYTTLVPLSRFVETMRLNLVVERDISLIVVSTGYIYLGISSTVSMTKYVRLMTAIHMVPKKQLSLREFSVVPRYPSGVHPEG